jgi:hypothetical protein
LRGKPLVEVLFPAEVTPLKMEAIVDATAWLPVFQVVPPLVMPLKGDGVKIRFRCKKTINLPRLPGDSPEQVRTDRCQGVLEGSPVEILAHKPVIRCPLCKCEFSGGMQFNGIDKAANLANLIQAMAKGLYMPLCDIELYRE